MLVFKNDLGNVTKVTIRYINTELQINFVTVSPPKRLQA